MAVTQKQYEAALAVLAQAAKERKEEAARARKLRQSELTPLAKSIEEEGFRTYIDLERDLVEVSVTAGADTVDITHLLKLLAKLGKSVLIEAEEELDFLVQP